MTTVSFTVNGTAVLARTDHPHLLAALREELDPFDIRSRISTHTSRGLLEYDETIETGRPS